MRYKYIYGPVYSWRLGYSLGVDPLSCRKKTCTFDCIYCQIGKSKKLFSKRKSFILPEKLTAEIKSLPKEKVDYITFSGRGEPTLAKNLGALIKAVRKTTKNKIAVITNSSLVTDPLVRKDLILADFVLLKLDAPNQSIFEKINRPGKSVKLASIIRAIKNFRKIYKGKLGLQIMFVEQNKRYAKELADIARQIRPDEVQINTPLRPCAARPLGKKETAEIKKLFKGLKVKSVYDKRPKKISPISSKATIRRRGKAL